MQPDHDSIAVWQIDLVQFSSKRAACVRVLSPSERARADRYKVDVSRETFILVRGALRHILGNLIAMSPEQVPLSAHISHKPGLTNEHATWQFNVSHTRGLALIAVAQNTPVGVDVEYLAPLDEMQSIARRYFSFAEWQQLKSTSEREQLGAFYRIWTRKEAYIKARGEGLRYPLDAFDVHAGDRDDNLLLEDRHHPNAADTWHIQSLSVPVHYEAALTVQAHFAPQVIYYEAGHLLTI